MKAVPNKDLHPSAPGPKDFNAAFTALKRILKPYEPWLFVKIDQPGEYLLETKSSGFRRRPLCFGAVTIRKNYVSFHLMSVCANPKLMPQMSPELKKRMQGKACFNFTAPDPRLSSELNRLAEASFEKFRAEKWLQPRPIASAQHLQRPVQCLDKRVDLPLAHGRREAAEHTARRCHDAVRQHLMAEFCVRRCRARESADRAVIRQLSSGQVRQEMASFAA